MEAKTMSEKKIPEMGKKKAPQEVTKMGMKIKV